MNSGDVVLLDFPRQLTRDLHQVQRAHHRFALEQAPLNRRSRRFVQRQQNGHAYTVALVPYPIDIRVPASGNRLAAYPRATRSSFGKR